jgi:lipoyl(octanoyl) transferase
LEEVLIRTCADFEIPARRIAGLTGVWTGEDGLHPNTSNGETGVPARRAESQTQQHSDNAKIGALGVHISRGVTSHGLALNVNADLSFFNLIVPCGIASKPVTSMQQQLNRTIPMQDVAHVLSRNFGTVFHSQILWLDNLDALLGNNLGVPMQVPENLRKLHSEDDSARA